MRSIALQEYTIQANWQASPAAKRYWINTEKATPLSLQAIAKRIAGLLQEEEASWRNCESFG